MRIVERGQKRPKEAWVGRYLCAWCKSVIALTEEDAPQVQDAAEGQRDGWSVRIMCPVCEEVRSLMDCNGVLVRCGGLGHERAQSEPDSRGGSRAG